MGLGIGDGGLSLSSRATGGAPGPAGPAGPTVTFNSETARDSHYQSSQTNRDLLQTNSVILVRVTEGTAVQIWGGTSQPTLTQYNNELSTQWITDSLVSSRGSLALEDLFLRNWAENLLIDDENNDIHSLLLKQDYTTTAGSTAGYLLRFGAEAVLLDTSSNNSETSTSAVSHQFSLPSTLINPIIPEGQYAVVSAASIDFVTNPGFLINEIYEDSVAPENLIFSYRFDLAPGTGPQNLRPQSPQRFKRDTNYISVLTSDTAWQMRGATINGAFFPAQTARGVLVGEEFLLSASPSIEISANTSVTSSTWLDYKNRTVLITNTSGNASFTLAADSASVGDRITIKQFGGTGTASFVQTSGTVDGQTSYPVTNGNAISFELTADNTWRVTSPTIGDTSTLEPLSSVPSTSGRPQYQQVNVNGDLLVLVPSTEDSNIIRGEGVAEGNYITTRRNIPGAANEGSFNDPAYIGEFQWRRTGVGPLIRARFDRRNWTGSPPATLYIRYVDADGYTIEAVLNRDSARDAGSGVGSTATGAYGYASATTGERITTGTFTNWTVLVFSDNLFTMPEAMHVMDRWEEYHQWQASTQIDEVLDSLTNSISGQDVTITAGRRGLAALSTTFTVPQSQASPSTMRTVIPFTSDIVIDTLAEAQQYQGNVAVLQTATDGGSNVQFQLPSLDPSMRGTWDDGSSEPFIVRDGNTSTASNRVNVNIRAANTGDTFSDQAGNVHQFNTSMNGEGYEFYRPARGSRQWLVTAIAENSDGDALDLNQGTLFGPRVNPIQLIGKEALSLHLPML